MTVSFLEVTFSGGGRQTSYSGLGKGKTQQRQNQSNQSGDREVCCAGKGDMGPGARGFMTTRDERSQDFGVGGGVLFQKYTGSSLSLFLQKKS